MGFKNGCHGNILYDGKKSLEMTLFVFVYLLGNNASLSCIMDIRLIQK